jgi:hypothetical protein
MGVHRYFIQLSPARLRELKADDKSVEQVIANGEVDRYPECTVEKTWNAIEFILTYLSYDGHFPKRSPLFRGSDLGFASCWSARQVAAIADALSAIDSKLLRTGYHLDLMHECNVYPNVWDRADEKEWNFKWIREHFRNMVKYFKDAAARGNAMLGYAV